jgi:hypothetical protein
MMGPPQLPTLDPSPHRGVIGMHAPLGEQLLHITVGKLAPLEQSGNRWAPSLSGHTPELQFLSVG